MSKPVVFYRLEIITRTPDTLFGDSTVSIFDSLERAKKTAQLFREKLGFTGSIKIYRIISEEVENETE